MKAFLSRFLDDFSSGRQVAWMARLLPVCVWYEHILLNVLREVVFYDFPSSDYALGRLASPDCTTGKLQYDEMKTAPSVDTGDYI